MPNAISTFSTQYLLQRTKKMFVFICFQVSTSSQSEIQHTVAWSWFQTMKRVLWFYLAYRTFIFLGSYVECYCMYFVFLQSLYLWSFFMYIFSSDLWFCSFTVSLRLCLFFYFFCVACQMYCISKDVKVYFNFLKQIKYHDVRKYFLFVWWIISVSSESRLNLLSNLLLLPVSVSY